MIDFYCWRSGNNRKIFMMLEETGLDYTRHIVHLRKGEQFAPDYLKLNPNNKTPTVVDQDGPGGEPFTVFESGAILIYLAEKTGKFLSADPAERYQTIQWVMFQMGAIGPMFGQLGFFHRFAGKEYEDKRPRDRYVAESRRLLGVLETRLANEGGEPRDWIIGDYSIADIATLGWVRNLIGFYEAGEIVGFQDFPHVAAWLERGLARPAVQRALEIPSRT